MSTAQGDDVAGPSSALAADAVVAYREVTHTVVVKKCLIGAMSPTLLPYQRDRFLVYVD